MSAIHAAIHTATSAAARKPASSGDWSLHDRELVPGVDEVEADRRPREVRGQPVPGRVADEQQRRGDRERHPAETKNETIVPHPSRRQPTARRWAATAVVANTGRKVKSANTRMNPSTFASDTATSAHSAQLRVDAANGSWSALPIASVRAEGRARTRLHGELPLLGERRALPTTTTLDDPSRDPDARLVLRADPRTRRRVTEENRRRRREERVHLRASAPPRRPRPAPRRPRCCARSDSMHRAHRCGAAQRHRREVLHDRLDVRVAGGEAGVGAVGDEAGERGHVDASTR